MAKKKENVVADDDFDLESMEEFDFSMLDPDVKDDRKPIIKAADGFKTGVKERLSSPSFLKEALKNTFPKSFGQAIDLSDEVGASVKNLYDESVAEIKPTLQAVKKTAAKLVPADSTMLPKSIQSMLARWREDSKSDERGQPSQSELNEQVIGQTVQELFGGFVQVEQQRLAEQQGRDNLAQGMEQVRHRTLLDVSNRSSISLKRLDDYTTTVGMSYQRKSMELQYRQLFATQDMLAFAKLSDQRRDVALASITKNTGLPEYVKLQTAEAGKEMQRRKLFDMYHTAVFGGADKFLRQGVDKLKRSVVDGTRNFMGEVRNGASTLEMASDMTAGGMVDKSKMAGSIIGEQATQWAGNTLGARAYSKLKDSDMDKRLGITDKFHKLDGHLTNLPNQINEFRKDTSDTYATTMWGKALNMLRDIIPSMSPDKSLAPTTSKNLFDVATFSNQTNRSIVEVIPGFLARIYRELQVLRTGNDAIDLTDFSHDRGTFVDRGELIKAIDRQITPERNLRYTRENLNEMVEKIDPQGQMSAPEREALKKRLLTNSSNRDLGSEKRLANEQEYVEADKTDPQVAKLVAQRMDAYLKGLSPEEMASFSTKHNRLVEHMHDPRQQLQDMLESGHVDQLRKSNLLTEDGEKMGVNLQEIIRRYLDENYQPPAGGQAAARVVPTPTPSAPPTGGLGPITAPAAPSVLSRLQSLVPPSVPAAASSLAAQAGNTLGAFSQRVASYAPQVSTKIAGMAAPAMAAMPQMPNFSAVPQAAMQHMQALQQAVAQRAQPFSAQAAALVNPENLQQTVQNLGEQVTQQAGQARDKVVQTAQPHMAELASGMRVLFGRLNQIGTLVAEGAKNKIQRVTPHLKAGAAHVGQTVNTARQNVAARMGGGFSDVYVVGEDSPRLLAVKLEAGEYYLRSSGKAVTSMKEIREAVMDEDGNFVVMAHEVGELAYHNTQTNTLVRLHERPATLGEVVRELSSAARIGTMELGRASLNTANTLISQQLPSDVYVEGEKEPRLTALRMARGYYRDAETGDAINTPQDIKGAVVDRDGRTVLAKDELGKLSIYSMKIGGLSPLRLVKWVAKKAWEFETKIAWPWAKWNLRQLGRLTMAAGRALKRTGAWMLGIQLPDPPRDVYVAGEASPRLEASRFAKGEYFDRETGKTLRSERDIQGVVVDRSGTTIVDTDDLPNLVSFDNKVGAFSPLRLLKLVGLPFRALGWLAKKTVGALTRKTVTGLKKVVPRVGAILGAAGSLAAAGARGVLGIKRQAVAVGAAAQANSDKLKDTAAPNSLLGMGKRGLDALKGKFAGKSTAAPGAAMSAPEVATVKSAGTLEQILSTIKSAFSGKKPSVGERKGGFLDRLNNQSKQIREGQKSFRQELADRLARKGKEAKGKDKEEEGDGLLDMLGKLKSIRSAIGGLAKVAGGIAGLFGLGAAGTAAAGGAAAAGAGVAGAAAATGAVAAGTAAAGTAAVATAGTAAAAAGGAGVMGTLGAMAAGVGAFISAPVVLGVAATAAVGYGAYRGLKYLNRGALDSIGRARMTQYGFQGEDRENVKKVIDLESALEDAIVSNGNLVDLDYKKVKVLELIRLFGLDPMVQPQRQLFLEWFRYRFKPVYLTHLTVLKNITGKAELAQISELDDAQRERYLSEARFPEGPYQFDKLPVLGGELKATTAQDVTAAYDAAVKALLATKKGPGVNKTPGMAKKLTDALPIGGAQAAQTRPNEVGPAAPTPKPEGAVGAPKRFGMVMDPASPDSEPKPSVNVDATKTPEPSASAPGSLPLAPGQPGDGRNGPAWLSLASSVNLDQLNPAMRAQFLAMAEEYGTLTGKKVPVTDGHRTYEEQQRMYVKYPGKAAKPGTSMHEKGLAIDADSKTLQEMEQLGLMRKYGFTRPVGGEPWHVEPIGIQEDLGRYKNDPNAAQAAIEAGLGRGGSGLGAQPGSKMGTRSRSNALAIAQAGSTPTTGKLGESGAKSLFGETEKKVRINDTAPTNSKVVGYASGAARAGAASLDDEETSGRTANRGRPQRTGSVSAPGDVEMAPGTTGTSGIKPQRSAALKGSPADPSVKVPEAKGKGVDAMRETVRAAAKLVGTDPDVTMQLVAMESGFDPEARAGSANGTQSSATGLGQFTAATWREYMGKYAQAYGLDPATPPTNAKASAIMTALYLKDNAAALAKTGMPVGGTEAYMAHFLGRGGATTFLTKLKENPNAVAAELMPKAADSNRSIFYEKDRGRTLAEVYALLDNRLREKSQAFGLSTPPATQVAQASERTGLIKTGAKSAKGEAVASAKSLDQPAQTPAVNRGITPVVPPRESAPVKAAPQAVAVMAAQQGPQLPSAYPDLAPRQIAAQPPRSMVKPEANNMAGTEQLLGQQLGVQQQLLTTNQGMHQLLGELVKKFDPKVLLELIGSSIQHATAAQAEEPAAPATASAGAGPAYNVPTPRVSMDRRQA